MHWINEQVGEVDAFLLSDYAKGVVSRPVAQHFIHLARLAGKPVIVDPKGNDYSKYCGAAVLTPNLHEAEAILRTRIVTDEDVMEAGTELTRIFRGISI
jgi:D-beta-D-heptose 7-phosphate kinase / D-beta-D-heptose 1-phosphate adenosyltransferase